MDPDMDHDLDIDEAREQDDVDPRHFDKPASEKQLKFIWGLTKTLGRTPEWHSDLTMQEARIRIETLLIEKESRGL